jgi:hypothetical protein
MENNSKWTVLAFDRASAMYFPSFSTERTLLS